MFFLGKICEILKNLIEEKRYDQAYDWVDAIHYIPLIIKANKKTSDCDTKKLIKEYEKKWGKLLSLKG